MLPAAARLCLWGSARLYSCGPLVGCSRWPGRFMRRGPADLLSQVLGVVLDEAEQRRASGVLPGQADEVEPGRFGHAALVHDRALSIEYRHVDPGVVEAEASGPNHRADVQLGVVAELHRRAGGVKGPSVELDTVATQAARAGADQRVFVGLHPPADPGVPCLADESGLVEVPEQVAAEEALRERLLRRTDRDMHLARGGKLLGDLVVGVAATNHEHSPLWNLLRRAVGGAVHLDDLGTEALGDRWHEPRLERSGGDHDLVSIDRAVLKLDEVGPVDATHRGHPAAELNRQLEAPGVLGQIVGDLIFARVAVGV